MDFMNLWNSIGKWLLIGSLFFGTGYAQQKFTEAQLDSIKLDQIMMPQVRNNDYLYFQVSPSVKIGKEEKGLTIKVKKPHEALEVEIFVDEDNMFKDIYLDESTIYLIHKEKSAFSSKEYSIIYSPEKHIVNYTLDKEEINEDPAGGEVLGEGEDFLFKTFKGIINKNTLKDLLKVLDQRQFMRDVYERAKAIQEGNLLVKDHVYIEEFPIHAAADLFDKPQKKYYKLIITRGEKSIDGIVVFYSLRKEDGIFSKKSNVEYEVIKLRK